ncbi:MAG: hypothetical protein QM699_16845 [Amaricoccus sp.]|uniref:hypothetical protein n=1 Tax=Amaricoccus sp. TaxID=1872485 RepID=UPI0039E5A9F5
MTSYDYKVVPAPRRARKIKGVKGADELFAQTLGEAINEVARQGWEYVRTESLVAEGPAGWFRRGATTDQVVMVFRRPREALGPRLAAVGSGHEPTREPELVVGGRERPAVDRAVERVVVDRLQSTLRHQPARMEPRLDDGDDMSPVRPGPRLGPADPS